MTTMDRDGVTGVVSLRSVDHPTRKNRGTAGGLGDGGFTDSDVTRTQLMDARNSGDVGLVHSWELVTAVDGPGTRLTLFLSGCPLRCLYCHNPDTMEMKTGTLESIGDITAKVLRYQRVFAATRGGLTISGGEPLFQIAFTRQLLRAVHDAGVHTTIDTSGFLGSRLSDEDLDTIDLVLLDVKSSDPETYRQVTGRELQPTLDFGDRLTRLGKRMWVRFVLVPGLTDAEDNIKGVARIVSQWRDTVERVEVLPFHNMGADKWEALGRPYQLADVAPPTPESVEHARAIFRSHGLNTY